MIAYQDLMKGLNTEQKAAVEHIEGPVLVIAGPGTGKTQLLTTRVAHILQSNDAQVEAHNILCLTFTESAAFEMRQRLVNIIGQKAYNITISTYHAFGSELIKRFPDYFATEGDLQAIDELGQYNLLFDIIEGLPYSNALKKSDNYVYDIKSTISDLKQARLSPDDVRNVAKVNQAFIKDASTLCKKELSGIVRLSPSHVPMFENLLSGLTKIKSTVSPSGIRSLKDIAKDELEGALEDFSETKKTSTLTAWKNRWLERNSNGDFVFGGVHTVDKLLGIADIFEQYEEALRAQGLFDYNDMILRASSGLENNEELRFTLQEQYQYIHLDEFQDTNAAQLELVNQLTNSPIYEGRPNILAVGDDDQAIYAFQGADYSHMLKFTRMYKDVMVVNLTKNYRSHADVLHVAHGVASQIQERLSKESSGIQKALSAESKQLPGSAIIARHEFKSDVAQFAWVSEEIARLIKQGAKPNEIVILAPKHRYLEPAVPYLRQLSIPVHYEKRENVLDDTHIIQLLRMAELALAIRHSNDAIANSLWPEVLSFDFWELPTEAIWQISWRASEQRSPWVKVMLENNDTKNIAQFFLYLAGKATIETMESLLDVMIGVEETRLGAKQKYRSPMYNFYFSKDAQKENTDTFWNVLSNLTVLRQRLRDSAKTQKRPLLLQDLVTFADEHKRAGIKVLNTSPYHESTNAVQIMTAYKAKGLEFEHVFVLACLDEVWGSRSKTQSARVPLPQNLNFVRYQGASDDERLRLLFVAITRAKHGLYLTSYENNYANRPTSRLKYLNESEKSTTVTSPLLPNDKQDVRSSDTHAPLSSDLTSYWFNKHLASRNKKSLGQLLKPRIDRYQLAPTHLNKFVDTVYGGPYDFFLTTILKFPHAPTKSGEFGNAIHATLEWVHAEQVRSGKVPSTSTITKYFSQDLRKRTLSKQDIGLLEVRGVNALSAFMEQRATTFVPSDLHEVNFKNQGVFVGDAHLSGKIDKLVIDPKKREIVIVDYKTGDSYDSWEKSNAKLHKYKQQLYMYKLLVEGSHQFADYRVVDAYLEFVEPNEIGKVTQLHFDFDAQEMQELKRLIQATWAHIVSLDFPDISQYDQTLLGTKAFEQDLIKTLPK